MNATHNAKFLDAVISVAGKIDHEAVDRIADRLALTRTNRGRVFIAGVGGGSGNATHAVCDMRNLAGIEAYAPTDNAATLTALINDTGWRSSIGAWLTGSRIGAEDVLIVFSVGGGSADPAVSTNLVEAVHVAVKAGAYVCGVVGPQGGETARYADECIRVPVHEKEFQTTHTEIYQSVIWHMLVTHPAVATASPHWESLCP